MPRKSKADRAFEAEARRRLADLDDPVRYQIRCHLLPSIPLWYDVSGDLWCSDRTEATYFKRREMAEVVLIHLGHDKYQRVVRVTPKK